MAYIFNASLYKVFLLVAIPVNLYYGEVVRFGASSLGRLHASHCFLFASLSDTVHPYRKLLLILLWPLNPFLTSLHKCSYFSNSPLPAIFLLLPLFLVYHQSTPYRPFFLGIFVKYSLEFSARTLNNENASDHGSDCVTLQKMLLFLHVS